MTAKQVAGYLKAKKAPDGISFNDGYNVTTYGITMDEYRAIDQAMHDAYGLSPKRTPAGVREALRLHGPSASRHHATMKASAKQPKGTLMRNVSTPFEEKYQTWDGNVIVTNFKRGLWSVHPRGHEPFMVGSKRDAFDQALGIATRKWGAKDPGHRSHATRKRKLPERYEVVETIDGDWMILIDGIQTGSKRDRSGAGSDTYPTHKAAREAALDLAYS